MNFLSFIVLLSCVFLTSCTNEPAARQAKFFAFGTEIDVSLFGVEAEAADNTVAVLEAAFTNVNDTWHAWQPSTLTNINNAISQGESIPVSDEVTALINQAKSLAIKSDHLFNPAAGKLFELWGFHNDAWFESRPPPSQQTITRWLQTQPSMTQISIDNGILSSENPHIKLGFGAFAKGHAVDSAIRALKQQGINNAIVNIGGDLRAIGTHGRRPWIIGIRHPRHESILGSIALHDDESVFTSGDYERFFEYNGTRYPHILNPKTGWPANQAISVTVLHSNASEADAAATALFVAGHRWPTIAASLGINHVMLVRPDGEIEMSPLMAERIRLTDQSKSIIIRPIESSD